MAACATSRTAPSGWCARRWPSARCCCASRRISCGRCASCCRREAADRPAWMLRLGLFLYDWHGRTAHPRAAQKPSTSRRRRRRAAQAAFHATGSNIPTARSTIRASWCSTRSTPRRAGRPSARARAACAPSVPANGRWCSTRAAAATSRPPACWSMRPAPGSAAVAETVLRLDHPLPLRLVKGSHIVVTRLFDHGPRLYPADRGRPLRVRASRSSRDFTLIGTTDEDFAGDPGGAGRRAARDRLSVRRGERLFPPARSGRTTWSGLSPAYARCMTMRPATRKTPRANMCSPSISTSARPRC